MSKLIKLTNGTRVRSDCVISIRAIPENHQTLNGDTIPPKVVVGWKDSVQGSRFEIITTETFADAELMRDQIAAEVEGFAGNGDLK